MVVVTASMDGVFGVDEGFSYDDSRMDGATIDDVPSRETWAVIGWRKPSTGLVNGLWSICSGGGQAECHMAKEDDFPVNG